jgi:hypothetical protein
MMNLYSEHESGLLLSMLASDTPSYGALKYVRDHNLYSWEAAIEIINRDMYAWILLRDDMTNWEVVTDTPIRTLRRATITRFPGGQS